MASSILTCISSAMDDLHLLENLCPAKSLGMDYEFVHLISLKVLLGNFRTFLLCAKQWENYDNDASLGSLISRTEAAISELGQAIHNFYLTCLEDEDHMPIDFLLPTDNYVSVSQSFMQWYLVFSEDCSSKSRSTINKDDLVEFMDSVADLLGDILYYSDLCNYIKEVPGTLREMVTFFRNFIRLVTLSSVEEEREYGCLDSVLCHAEFVAVNVAFMTFALCDDPYMPMDSISDLLLRSTIRVEPVVHETCVQALIASKSSIDQSMGEGVDEDLLTKFVLSLLFYMWQILKNEVCLMIILKDQLQVLWEGLISLRTILKGNRPKFDEEMRDVIRLVLCDAGLVLFSLCFSARKDGSVKDMDFTSFQDFVENLRLVKLTFAEMCPEKSSSNFPRTDLLGFLDFLVKHMIDLTNPEEGSSLAIAKYPIQAIRAELVSLRPFLEKIVDMRHEDVELQALWNRVVEVAHRSEFLVDSLFVEDNIPDSCSILLFDSILENIKIIKADALKILDTKIPDLKVKEITKRSGQIPSQRSKPMIRDMITVGLEDQAISIISRLKRGSSQLQIVPIVGMPGLGKTTLAKRLYNDCTIISYFHNLAWCTVSQEYHKKHVLLEILSCIRTELPNKFSGMCEEDLALEVKQGLQRTRYLIVMDDVWDTKVWDDLEAIFPDNRMGSRVILTSRNHDIVVSRGDLNEGPHYLRPLNPNESWDLFNMMLHHEKKVTPSPKSSELQIQITEMCQGLPLTIVILAGILASEDQRCWERVVESLYSSIISSTDQCIATLELSYQNLSDNLKPCFLYFGAFPEDHEHTTEDLICLWIAEGFVQETQFKSAEDVAGDSLMDLTRRSLVIASNERSFDGVESYRVHDLLHEFCVRKGTEDNFLQFVRRYDDEPYSLHVPHHLRRLSINHDPKNFGNFRLFSPTIRSISFYSDNENYQDVALIVHLFKLVRVLDLSRVYLGSIFPGELAFLVQLRYLAIRADLQSIPSSIGKLLHLETLIVVRLVCDTVSLPDTIWNLKKLRRLQAKDTEGGICLFEFPCTDNVDKDVKLCALNTLSGVQFHSLEELDKILRRLPSLRKLECHFWDDDGSSTSADGILALDFLVGLESLTLWLLNYENIQSPFEFQFSCTVRELTLGCFYSPWSKLSAIQKLPNLEVLNILSYAFDGEIWNIEEEGFPKVNFLKLSTLDLIKWTASDCVDCFPSLRKLVLEFCSKLEEIPSCFGSSSTLEVIEVRGCPDCVDSIQQIQDEQREMGYTEMKVIIVDL